MADIDIECRKCGKVVTISEFADPTSIVCRKCGQKLEKPGATPQQKVKPTVRVLTKQETEAAAKDETPATEWRFHKHTQKEELPAQSAIFTAHHMGAWLVFIALGGTLGWLRYGSYLDTSQLTTMKEYGPFVFLIVHFLVILSAFKYSVFQGILSLMIPPYPYYFLFAVSDEFFLRAFVAGSLVGIGQDSFIFFSKEGVVIYNAVTSWIASGG